MSRREQVTDQPPVVSSGASGAGGGGPSSLSTAASGMVPAASSTGTGSVVVTQHPALLGVSNNGKHKKKYSGEAVPIRLDSDGQFVVASPDARFWPDAAALHHRREDSGGLLLATDNALDFEDEESQQMLEKTAKPHAPTTTTTGSGNASASSTFLRTTFVAPPSNAIKSLNSLTLFAILYASSIGGGYGFEDAVGLAGPLLVTVFCIVVPWIWCLPTALAVSELATAIPSNAGFLAWSHTAFPPVVTHFNVVCSIVSTFVSNAAYPALFAHYVAQYFGKSIESSGHLGHHHHHAASLLTNNGGSLFSASSSSSVNSNILFSAPASPGGGNGNGAAAVGGGSEALLKILVVFGAALLNCFGVSQVGNTALVVAAIATLPFVLMTFLQLTATMWREVVAGTQEGFDFTTISYVNWAKVDWVPFLCVASWNYGNYEAAASVTEEVANPQKALPRAFVPLMLSTYFTYLLPVWAGVSIFSAGREQHWSRWTTGYWSEVAFWIGGVPLQNLMRAGGVVVAVGYIVSNLCTTSRALAGIGQIGALPKGVSRVLATYHPRLGTPVAAIVANAVLTALCSVAFSFINLVSLAQVLYMVRMLMIYAALVTLRKTEPALRRPFCIPLSLRGLYCMLAPAATFCVVVLAVCATQDSLTMVMTVVFVPAAFAFSYFYVATVGFAPSGLAIMREPDPNDGCLDNSKSTPTGADSSLDSPSQQQQPGFSRAGSNADMLTPSGEQTV